MTKTVANWGHFHEQEDPNEDFYFTPGISINFVRRHDEVEVKASIVICRKTGSLGLLLFYWLSLTTPNRNAWGPGPSRPVTIYSHLISSVVDSYLRTNKSGPFRCLDNFLFIFGEKVVRGKISWIFPPLFALSPVLNFLSRCFFETCRALYTTRDFVFINVLRISGSGWDYLAVFFDVEEFRR